ncbi:MAG: ABC transporter ATP-binding protein/permease [Peptoniphilaceae bacterium]|nr:ABC transporter ATP-binding protein/permease [Peptoniphilaceae bacterium]MDY5766021.1 ABC transporter ATP-binding protein/permease [Peptoniphilaceae bacterium]
MLQIQNISKTYETGSLVQIALDQVSLTLRDNEFVSILGPSGSGKTTLLNIIGGLDRYDTGDLIVNGISTKNYNDRDWDSYRNHAIGFVFQSYNLIPHQSVLANVELALTISGVSRKKRREKATLMLKRVGLGDHLHKRPNQLSGGQMQRVAIARALVNDPEILLADEPTGALDTETSVQIMELLREVAKDRLVVMVTHNPELAEKYSTRIVRLRDGRIIGDSNFAALDTENVKAQHKNMGKARMSFFTSLVLSFKNLRTKKGRTFLTAFAGSIGIIGIALILALSSGVNQYIADIQRDTMTSYPITISAEELDLAGVMERGRPESTQDASKEISENRSGIHMDYRDIESSESIASKIKKNNLSAFKNYIDDPNSEIRRYFGENGVVYTYDVNFDVYSYNAEGKLINTDVDTGKIRGNSVAISFGPASDRMNAMGTANRNSSGAKNFSELMAGTGKDAVSPVIRDNYEALYGSWPQNYDEVVLVLNKNNAIPSGILYQLGFITEKEYLDMTDQIQEGQKLEDRAWSYEDMAGHAFYLVPASDQYEGKENGTFSYIGEDSFEGKRLLKNAVKLKIVGVIRPVDDAKHANISTAIAYTSKLTDYLIDHTNRSAVVVAQQNTPEVNVLNGLKFEAPSDSDKIADAKEYVAKLGVSDKASLYQMVLYYSMQNAESNDLPSENAASDISMGAAMNMDETSLASAMDQWVANSPDDQILLSIYDGYIQGTSYEENMKKFGKVNYDNPQSISIYTDSFEDKEAVSKSIENYNKTVGEENQITYTDYVALLTNSVTSIVDVISYVLIAFVAVSLIVSSIMIGIITHISVLERTKEIGILRALGASKRNISQVFNAETFIIGFFAGLLGIGISALLTIPINSILQKLIQSEDLTIAIPSMSAILLVVLSMAITLLGGWLPAKNAAKKDPVIALRTE